MNEKTLLADKDQYEAKAVQLQTALVQVQGILAYIRNKLEHARKVEQNGQETVTVPASGS